MSESNEILIGRVVGGLEQLGKQVGKLTAVVDDERKAASKARADLHQKVEKVRECVDHRCSEISKEIAPLKQKLDEYEPDMKRCRLYRQFGVVSAMIIGAVGAVVAFGADLVHIVKAFAKNL